MSYTPTNWQTGDTITAEKLNNMESGIEAATPRTIELGLDAYGVPYMAPTAVEYLVDSVVDGVCHFVFSLDGGLLGSEAGAMDAYGTFRNDETLKDVVAVIRGEELTNGSLYVFSTDGWDGESNLFPITKSSAPFIVTFTPTEQDYSGTMDKTVGEIKAAYKAGRKIVFRVFQSATAYVEVPASAMIYDGDADTLQFNIYILMDSDDVLVLAFNSGLGDAAAEYSTIIYPLTPMS